MITDTDRQLRAYKLWESEGRPEGRHVEHWQAAGMATEDAAGEQSDTEASQEPAEGSRQIVDKELAEQERQTK